MIVYSNKEIFIEFKRSRELMQELIATIEELEENWRTLRIVALGTSVTVPLRETVTEGEPFFLKQESETSEGAIGRIEHQLSQSGELTRSIPSVATVSDTARPFL